MSKKFAMQCRISSFSLPRSVSSWLIIMILSIIDTTAFAMYTTAVYLPTCQKQKSGTK